MNHFRESFHITVHARPPGAWSERSTLLDGTETRILDIPSPKLDAFFPVSFEAAASRLGGLPRLFIEPDGSFVWVSVRGETPSWQLDGMLYDRAGRLLYVELKGNCPTTPFLELLAAFGNAHTPFVVQLIRHAIVLDSQEFCRTRLI